MTASAGPRHAMPRSTTYAVETHALRKSYRTRKGQLVAVAGLDLKVPAGGVHGFLGPNGSGKTTTIRMLLGLIRADAGDMGVFGEDVPERTAGCDRSHRRHRRAAQVLPQLLRSQESAAAWLQV